jgi:hypothetical protein
MGSGRSPDEYEFLVAQAAEALDLLERLKAEPPSPKMNLAIVLVEEHAGGCSTIWPQASRAADRRNAPGVFRHRLRRGNPHGPDDGMAGGRSPSLSAKLAREHARTGEGDLTKFFDGVLSFARLRLPSPVLVKPDATVPQDGDRR